MAAYTPGVPSPQPPLAPSPGGTRSRGNSGAEAYIYRPDHYPTDASTPNYQTAPQGSYFSAAPPPPAANYFPTPTTNPAQNQTPYYQSQPPYGSQYANPGPNVPNQAPPYPTSEPWAQRPTPTQPMPIPGSQSSTAYMQAPLGNSFPGNNYLNPGDAARFRSESYSGPALRPDAGRHRRRSSPGAGRHRHRSSADEGRPHHHRQHHSHHGSLDRTDTHRPTLGDTMVSMFGVVKSYLGPVRRD